MKKWEAKWGWSDERNHETWWLFDTMPTDWIKIEDYHIWVDYHCSARLVIFHEKKMKAEMDAYEKYRDLMGEHMGRNK